LPESVKEEMLRNSARIQGAYGFDQTILILLGFGLHALSAKSGELLWKSEHQGMDLAGFDGTIYTYSLGLGSSADERYERLNAISGETGKLLWTYEIRQRYPEEDSSAFLRLASSPWPWPLVSEEGVYVATDITEPMGMSSTRTVGGVLLALDRATGALIWRYKPDVPYGIRTVNAGKTGIVYVNVESDTYALDGKTGALLWKQDGAFDLLKENVIYGRSRGGLMAVNAQNGDVLWRFSGDGARQFHEDAFLSGGVLYTVSDMGSILYALDATTGMPIWTCNMGDGFLTDYWALVSSLATVADGVLYIHHRDGGVSAIDIQQASVKLPPSPKLMAVNYLERGQYTEAIESGQQAIARNASDVSVLNILGWAYWKTGQTQQALSAFQQVLTLEQQGDAAAKAWGGISEIAQSEIEEEIFLEFCNKLASTAPEDAEFQIKRRLLLSEFHRSRGDLEAAEKEYVKTGFPKESDWLVIGPFDNTDDKGRTTAYPPEAEINIAATYQGKAGAVQWQKADDGQMNGRLDFTKIFTPTEWVVVYALIEVISPDDREAQLRIGSDDGVKVWLNGQVVWTNQVPRGLRLDEDVVPITLKKGTNRLLFKVDNGVEPWELAVRVTDASGQPLEGLQYVSAH
jgi:outer membrane protein assembly factor BamB